MQHHHHHDDEGSSKQLPSSIKDRLTGLPLWQLVGLGVVVVAVPIVAVVLLVLCVRVRRRRRGAAANRSYLDNGYGYSKRGGGDRGGRAPLLNGFFDRESRDHKVLV